MMALLLYLALLFATAPASAAQQAQPGYRISGVIIDAVTGAPVARAEVSIFLRTQETKTTSGGDGRFVFQGVEAGKYPIFATAQGYVREGYNQHGAFLTAIAVGSGLDSEHVVFRLHPQAVITGRVTDEYGEAVRHAQVMLFSTELASGRRAGLRARVQTDVQGEYRFAHLLPGKYYLAVQARPWYAQPGLSYQLEPAQDSFSFGRSDRVRVSKPDPLLDVAYPITFYPGVTDQHASAELNLTPGDKEEADIQLQAVPAVHVRLTNLPVDEKNRINMGANEKLFGSLDAALDVVSGQISPGEYEVAGLPPGDVTFIVNQSGNQEWSSRIIKANVSGGNTLDGAGTGATVNVSGCVILPVGDASLPQGQVSLLSEDNQTASARLQKDGTFSFPPLQVGTYKIFVNLQSGGQYVQRISASGAKTFGRQVTIQGAGDVQLNITMGSQLGQVTGLVQVEGKPTAGVMVLIVPESGENLEEDSRRDQSDSDGTFTLANILPGKYVLMAIEDGWELEWMNPGVVKPYREKGQIIQIAPNDTKKVTVEAQHTIK